MRILIATEVPRQREAGTAGVVLNHAAELRKLGHEVDCLFLDDILTEQERRGRFAALRFAFRIDRRIRAEPAKYNVVNLHGTSGCVYGYKRQFGSASTTPPFVFTIQGIVERHAHMMRREHRKGRAWHFSLKNRVWHRLYLQTMFNVVIRTADYGMASNREAWTYPEIVHDRDPGRIHYIPNGVEEGFLSGHVYEDRSPMRLLFVGTWLDRKGIYYLVDAFHRLIRKGDPVQLTVAGSLVPEEEVMKFFPPEAAEHVRVLPFVPRERMPALYAEHDIFLFPSLMEGMPLSLLEAMASGLPVVSTYNSGMADVLEHRFNGLAVPDADAIALAEAVDELRGSVLLRKRLGEEAARTMRRYTWGCVARQVQTVLCLAVANATENE